MCGEWEFGGLPAWLLQKNATIRTYENNYIAYVDKWWAKLLPVVKPYLYSAGGPVIMMQIENEFGSYGNVADNPKDKQYMQHLVGLARAYLGDNLILYTTDGGNADYMRRGTLPGSAVYTVGDFGPGSDPASSFAAQKQFNPPGQSPNMCSEFYTGWISHWRAPQANTSSAEVAQWLDRLLALNGSVSLYMAHGGSNFGFWSGANGGGDQFTPVITSYDYNAPLSEAGAHGYGSDGVDKFAAVLKVLSKYNKEPIPAEPRANNRTAYGTAQVTEALQLFRHLDTACEATVTSQTAGSMSAYGQNFGYILYTTTIPDTLSADADGNVIITVPQVRDRVSMYANDVPLGVLLRGEGATTLSVSASSVTSGATLRILVENMGRINYGHGMTDPKGLIGGIELNGAALSGFTVCTLPMTSAHRPTWHPNGNNAAQSASAGAAAAQLTSSASPGIVPLFLSATLSIQGEPTDTWLYSAGWGKGAAWVNGHPLGRYWDTAGPQHALYVPREYLQSGDNTVELFETDQVNSSAVMGFLDGPVYFMPTCCPTGTAAPGSNIAMWPCDGVVPANADWDVSGALHSGPIRLISDASLCLQAGPGKDPSSGSPNVGLATCATNDSAQRFAFNETEGTITAVVNGEQVCLDVTSHATNAGANVEVYSCNGGSNQQWSRPSGTHHITGGGAGHCMTICV